jgi:hypothetical protein
VPHKRLPCGRHALIPVGTGDYIVHATHRHGDFTIYVYRLGRIEKEQDRYVSTWFTVPEKILIYSKGQWNENPPSFLRRALEAAMTKAQDYDCCQPYYILN